MSASENVLRGDMSEWCDAVRFPQCEPLRAEGGSAGPLHSEALGVDRLPSGAFKYAPSSLIAQLCLFINACTCLQYTPRPGLAMFIMLSIKFKAKDSCYFQQV